MSLAIRFPVNFHTKYEIKTTTGSSKNINGQYRPR